MTGPRPGASFRARQLACVSHQPPLELAIMFASPASADTPPRSNCCLLLFRSGAAVLYRKNHIRILAQHLYVFTRGFRPETPL